MTRAVTLESDSDELRRALEFLRRHELRGSERALAKELNERMGGGGGDDDEADEADDDDERGQRMAKGVSARLAGDADESEDESEDEGESSASWQPSLLRRLQSVSVNGGAMAAMVPKEEAEEKARTHVRSVSAILPYDLLENASSYEEVLEDWRRKAETACEYVDEEDEGFDRYYVPRHEVRRHLVDTFVVDDCRGEEAGGECVDGHVQFSPDMKANAEQTTSAEKKTRVLDRGESFTFGDVPAVDADDGLETPIPQGWVDSERDAASNAFEAFHLKVFHQGKKTGFQDSKDFIVKHGDVVANRYKIIEGIGRAAFSKTVRAHDLQTNIPVCLKIVSNNKDHVDQGLDEIKLLRLINAKDPNDTHGLLRMFDFFYFKEHLFIVSELLRANLYEFQKYNAETAETPYFTLSRVRCIAKQVLESLTFLHSLDLIHCDLKPENILMKSYADCSVKLIDFGSSCFTTDTLSSYAQSRAYRAPEVIIGAKYSQKIDVWSLGCILAELYSGRMLFRNSSVPSLLARMVSIRGPFDTKLLARGTQSHKYFTKQGFLHEIEEMSGTMSILRPKRTCLKTRLGAKDDVFIDFLEKLLVVDPEARLSASEALQHPWLS